MKEHCYFLDLNQFIPLNDDDPINFISTNVGSILQINPENNNEIQIGKIIFKIVHIGEALNDGKNIHEIFDYEEYLLRIGRQVFDFEESDLNEDIQNFYNYSFKELKF